MSSSPNDVVPPSAAISILQERLSRGEISPEEFTQRLHLIQGARP